MDRRAIYGDSRWSSGERKGVGRAQVLARDDGTAPVQNAVVQASKLVGGRISSRTNTSASQTLGQSLTSLKDLRYRACLHGAAKPGICVRPDEF